MRSITLKAWTRWLLIGTLNACILFMLNHEEVQAFSLPSEASSELNDQSYSSMLLLVKSPVLFGINYMIESTGMVEVAAMKTPTEGTAVIMLTGDLMCLGGQQNSVNIDNTFDFNPSFTYASMILKKADLTIGNLETLISPSNAYTYQQKTINNAPNCNAMESYLDAIKNAGFDVVVTANNHCLDGGITGILETLQALDKYEIAHTGTYENEEHHILLCEVNGIRIAILSYTEIINGRNTVPASVTEAMVSCYSKELVENDVIYAKQLGADFIIAYNHWGTENTHELTSKQVSHAKEIANAGVDLIIGSHPHCLQKAEYIQTEDGRSVLCMYSMGNFVSSMTREINSDTIILELVLHKNEDLVYTGSIGYYSLKVIRSYDHDHYVILPIKSQLHGEYQNYHVLNNAQKRIETVIGDAIPAIH